MPIPAHEAADEIDKGIAQLRSMLATIYGGGIDNFHELAKERQDAYLWACYDKLRQIEAAWSQYCQAQGRLQ